MKSIDTLVDDILSLVGNPDRSALDPDRITEFAAGLAARVSTKITEDRVPSGLRMSNFGMPCERHLWYRVNRPELAEKLPAAARMKFLYGDILEELLLFLARETGHTVEREQERVEFHGVVGHIDAVIDGVLVDCKSASTMGFNKFADGLTDRVDSFGYLDQLDLYLNGLGLSEGGFLVIDKTLGKVCFDKHKRRDTDWAARIDAKRRVLAGPLPDRPYHSVPDGASGNEKLGVECSYCEFNKSSWPGLRVFAYANGPRFLTTVRKKPDVPEIT